MVEYEVYCQYDKYNTFILMLPESAIKLSKFLKFLVPHLKENNELVIYLEPTPEIVLCLHFCKIWDGIKKNEQIVKCTQQMNDFKKIFIYKQHFKQHFFGHMTLRELFSVFRTADMLQINDLMEILGKIMDEVIQNMTLAEIKRELDISNFPEEQIDVTKIANENPWLREILEKNRQRH